MGTLYLVRHGQASFGAADYDQLSPLGWRQARRLGEHWRGQGLSFDAVYAGSLRRHRETWEGLSEGAQYAQSAQVRPALNEYDSHAVIEAIHPAPLEAPTTREAYKQHFRLLREGLVQWMSAATSPRGMPSYAGFVDGISAVLDEVRAQYAGPEAKVLVVSSGGPISTAVGQVLGTSPEATIELNMQLRNASFCELAITPRHLRLVSFNRVGHLEVDGENLLSHA